MRQPAASNTRSGRFARLLHTTSRLPLRFAGSLLALLVGAIAVLLATQIPATHRVNIGGYDAAYVQDFAEPVPPFAGVYPTYPMAPTNPTNRNDPAPPAEVLPGVPAPAPPPFLAGSDGQIRPLDSPSYLLFPQAGLPAEVTLRLRGWQTERITPTIPPLVGVWLNGQELLAEIPLSNTWQTATVPVRASPAGGLFKASDVLLELRLSETADGEEQAGALLDQATYRVVPDPLVRPYPAQVVAGALAGWLLWLLVRPSPAAPVAPQGRRVGRRVPRWVWLLVGGVLCLLLYLLLYRLPPPLYPYPLRGLPVALVLLLAGLVLLRHTPALLARFPRLPLLLLPLVVLAWAGRVWQAAREHVTLAVPGVEADFRVFATRTVALEEIFRADGFYNLGYPLLLWLVQPCCGGNAFLAARIVALLSGAVLLLAGYWLAHSLLAHIGSDQSDQSNQNAGSYRNIGALLAVVVLACNPLVAQYALYVGSDMPFAALVALTLALLVAASLPAAASRRTGLLLLAGLTGGAAFLVRHPGLVLLLWGVGHCLLLLRGDQPGGKAGWQRGVAGAGWFVLGFLLAASPQLLVNTLQTGQPLYNQQAKNIWLAVYGNIDWGRWNEVPNSIGLRDIVLRDPPRFLDNWLRNIAAFLGRGAEDTSEFGRAMQVRLLSAPANWLALAGMLGWLLHGIAAPPAAPRETTRMAHLRRSMLAFGLLYVAVVAMAFVLLRFFLPLVVVYAAAAAWAVLLALRHTGQTRQGRGLVAALLVLLVLLWGGVGNGTRAVLSLQPPDEAAAIRLTLAQLEPGQQVLTRLPAEVPLAKYSALAHRAIPWPASDVPSAAVLRTARTQGAAYLLWDARQGTPPLANPAAARVGSSGRYTLYRLAEE